MLRSPSDDDIRSAIANSQLLGDAVDDVADRLIEAGQVRLFRKRTYLFHQGDESDRVYLLLSGVLEVVSVAEGGQEQLHVHMTQPEFFGELGALGGTPRTASVMVLEDALTWSISTDAFVDIVTSIPSAARSVTRALAARFQEHEGLIEDLMFLDLRGRVAKKLLQLAEDGTTHEITQAALASMVGGTRENVARIVSEFQRKEIIERDGKRYLVLQPERLERLASH